jgi:hypothetical protein
MHLSGKNPARKPGCEFFYGDFPRRFFARQRDLARWGKPSTTLVRPPTT